MPHYEYLWASLVAQMVKNLPACRRPGFDPWNPWRRKWQPTPVFLPGECLGQRSLAGYSPLGCKELDMTERLHFHFLCFFLSSRKLGSSGRQQKHSSCAGPGRGQCRWRESAGLGPPPSSAFLSCVIRGKLLKL